MASAAHRSRVFLCAVAGLLVLSSGAFEVHAQPATTITAYQAQIPVNVKAPYNPSDWTDTMTFTEPTSGMTFAAKQNGTGWLFLMKWGTSIPYCQDQSCFGGIELGHLNNTSPMGSPSTITIMILASQSFTGGVDEFISQGEETPSPVESYGYATQSVCGLAFASNEYTVQCYRPFVLANASPYDFPNLGVGSTIEIGFAVGEFSNPGDHAASDMSTYLLTFSDQTYTAPSTSTSTSISTSTSSSTASSSSTSSTASSTTSTTSSTSTKSTTTSAAPSAATYEEELAVIVVGYSVLIIVVLTKYRSP